ncbi:hypothetical protein LOK74_23485 [Brevibacillus humidisoli]|uniref:hypothetical protein n=1 Tax=Brevibacillus humidisoli TaxID=2895522 RepID=UPI001E4730F2|nr:hypothetical protein [Brevibacillus humidisoli]UFJ40913.1 hypothetical protein LOK74_23485 [Brevibacillus humidisoli]
MSKSLLSLLTVLLCMMLISVVSANSLEAEVVFEADMNSETELLEDALAGKRDTGLDVSYSAEILDNEDVNISGKEGKKANSSQKINTYYTVQKLKEVREGDNVTESYVVLAVSDPTGYDDRDRDQNNGLNFRQTIWAWYDVYTHDFITYAKGTRYEARWDLLDSNRLTIKNGTFRAVADGFSPNNDRIEEESPSTYYPPDWGIRYVKTPKWDYVNVSGEGWVGAEIITDYQAGSSSGKLRSVVQVN